MAEGIDLERLAAENPDAHTNPEEPYQGVQALFDGDLHVVLPWWAPRQDWEVVSPYRIRLLPSSPDYKPPKDEDGIT